MRYPIPAWPKDERPRERLITGGAENLSEAELLAIILRVGTQESNAIELARELLARFGSLRRLDSAGTAELTKIKGIGRAKAAQVKAALELGKRLRRETREEKKPIRSSDDVVDYCREWFEPYLRDRKKEIFSVLLLDSKNRVMRSVQISEGTLTASLVHPREVLKEAITESACGVIVVHNHPSGDVTPSPEDIAITQRLVSACRVVGVHLLDHVIIGDGRPFSFLEKGLLEAIL